MGRQRGDLYRMLERNGLDVEEFRAANFVGQD